MDAPLSNQLSDEMTSDVVTDGAQETVPSFTSEELAALQRLQAGYQSAGDFLTPDEVARLQFVRWLYQTGRVEP